MKNAETYKKYHEMAIEFLNQSLRNQEISKKISENKSLSHLEKQISTLLEKELRKEEKEILQLLSKFLNKLENLCQNGHKTKDIKESAKNEYIFFTDKAMKLIKKYDQEMEELNNLKAKREILDIRSELY